MPLTLVENYNHGIINKISFFIALIINFITIDRNIRKKMPQMVVVGSDTANVNIRILLGLCMLYRIPILILYNADLNSICEIKYDNLINRLIYERLVQCKLFVFFRAIIYNCQVPGLYTKTSHICVISEDIKLKLEKCGVQPERVFVVGLDSELDKSVDEELKCNIKNDLNVSNKKLTIAFFTECISDIYNIEYSRRLYRTIWEEFEKLPQKFQVVIKLHPRESMEQVDFIIKTFTGSKYVIIRNTNPKDIILVSDLIIAHFSKVLIMAALMNKRILSINWKNEREKTFLSEEEGALLEIKSPEEVLNKINDALYNDEYINKAGQLIGGIAKRYKGSGEDMKKIVHLILNIAGRGINDIYTGYVSSNHFDGEKIKSV